MELFIPCAEHRSKELRNPALELFPKTGSAVANGAAALIA
jgi:hypothetical protein